MELPTGYRIDYLASGRSDVPDIYEARCGRWSDMRISYADARHAAWNHWTAKNNATANRAPSIIGT